MEMVATLQGIRQLEQERNRIVDELRRLQMPTALRLLLLLRAVVSCVVCFAHAHVHHIAAAVAAAVAAAL